MRHGSLFSGYGGIDRAIADVFGAETAWVSDVDPGANRILAHRYPDAPNLGDITAVDWSTIEPVGIVSLRDVRPGEELTYDYQVRPGAGGKGACSSAPCSSVAAVQLGGAEQCICP